MSEAALADDPSSIAAVVTAFEQQQMQEPGVFTDYTLIQDGSYAHVIAALGTSGNSSETFALIKQNNQWQVVLSSGGVMGVSELVTVGIPFADAKALQGYGCAPEPKQNPSAKFKVTKLARALVKAARTRWPSALPSRIVRIRYRGKLMAVRVYAPLSGQVCSL